MKIFKGTRSNESKLVKFRLTIVAATLGCVVFLLMIQALRIQIFSDPRLERLSRHQFQKTLLVRPSRGLIVDRNGEPFAVNIELSSLAANPQKIVNKKKLARVLGKILHEKEPGLLKKLSSQKSFIWIERQISEARMSLLRTLVDTEGLWFVRETKRAYPLGSVASQVVGSVNVDNEGTDGVEYWQNEKLQGKVASLNAVKDALGRPTFIDLDSIKDIKNGENVRLTIDSRLQILVEEILASHIKRTQSDSGSVIVMDSITGEILALANQPAFNPNERRGSLKARRNRVINDGYEPGSTMKAFLTASAFSNGLTLKDEVFGGLGKVTIQGRTIQEAESHERFAWMKLDEMLIRSSNVGAAKFALKIGANKYLETLKNFGFGESTHIGFPGELSGWLPKKRPIQPLTLATLAFGQGLFATPLQVARAFAAFANGGWLVEPSLLMDSASKNTPKKILTQKVLDQLLPILEAVVNDERGTGKNARLDGYKIAGKTGTAQVVDQNTKKYSSERYIASFVGFPMGVEPRVVILTLLDYPKGVYYAADTAAPLFRDVLSAFVSRYNIPARKLAVQSEPLPRPVSKDSLKTSASAPVVRGGADKGFIPNLVGLTAREVFEIFRGREVHLKMKGFGVVTGQSLLPGEPYRGKELTVVLDEN